MCHMAPRRQPLSVPKSFTIFLLISCSRVISDQCDVWGIYEFYIFQETKKVGQEVAFGQIVQTQRQRKESKRLDKLSRRRKRGNYA